MTQHLYTSRDERVVAARRRALASPWPWRMWAYACWLVDVLPAGPAMTVALCTILGTLGLILGLVFGLIWLWQTGSAWAIYLTLGWFAHLVLGFLWRGTRVVLRAILATDRAYRLCPDDEHVGQEWET